ncbi:unnamed protein product, partial [Pylaiella littoralis]
EQPRLPRQRPLSAPVRGRDPLLPGPSSSAARGAKTRRRQEQQRWQERRRRPETVSARQGAGCWRRDRDGGRRGGGRDTTIVGESFGCLQARLAKTVESSSNFVSDIQRLRKAGGLRAERDFASAGTGASAIDGGGTGRSRPTAPAAFAPTAVCSAGTVEPLALAKELGIHAIVDRVTHTIVHNNRATELSGRSGGGDDCGRRVVRGRRRRAGLEETLALSITNNTEFGAHDDGDDNRYRPPSASSSPARQQQKQRTQLSSSTPHCWSAGAARPVPSPVCPAPNRSSPTRNERPPKEDVERLRRVVRTTMLSLQTPPSSTSLYGGIASGGGLERGESRAVPPQWSQKHEACLADMRRRLRETGSPLLRAKDPAVLLGALLRRKGPLIRGLDEAVLSLEDTAEALNALVTVSSRLRLAGVSADGLFVRAGVVKTGAGGSLGPAPPSSGNANRAGGGGHGHNGKAGEKEPKVRRCTVKRIHAEIHRVLGDVASFRELKVALSACVRGGGGGGGGRGE